MSTPPNPWNTWQPQQPATPGEFPLRPLSVGELLTTGIRIAWRNIALLAPIAFAVEGLGAAAQLGILSATGQLDKIAAGTYAQFSANPTSAEMATALHALGALLLAVLATMVFSQFGQVVLSATASPLVGSAALSKNPQRPALARLSGRWGAILGAAALYTLIVVAGTALVVVGLLAMFWMMLIGPVAAMEGASPVEAVKRSLRLSKGFRPRIFGVYLLTLLFVGIATEVASGVVDALVGSTGSTQTYVIGILVGVVVGAFTLSWISTVTALLYVDIRMRKEGLGHALQQAAAAQFGRI